MNWLRKLICDFEDAKALFKKQRADKEVELFSRKLNESITKADTLGALITGGVLYEGENGKRQTGFTNIKAINLTCRW